MLDSLTFLLEKLFFLSYLRLFSLVPGYRSREKEPGNGAPARRSEREARICAPAECAAPPLRRGDLLEVPRTLFTHFGIYLGDGRVAHLIPDILPAVTSDGRLIREMVTNTRLLLGVLSKQASVRVDSVEDFAYGARILLNKMDHVVSPHRALANEDVALRAERQVGAVRYSLLWNNCEHFVTDCRYGSALSLQTDQFLGWMRGGLQDRRVALLSLLLVLMLWGGASPCTAGPALLLPFTLWMVS